MKLAEALILRADYQKRLEEIKQRAVLNAKVQEGDAPAESPQALTAQWERVASELTTLIQQINRTNATTSVDFEVELNGERAGTMSVADALAVRDGLQSRQTFYRALAGSATIQRDRYTRNEIRFESAIDVAAVQQQADRLARAHRELDAQIQATNWTTELVEDAAVDAAADAVE